MKLKTLFWLTAMASGVALNTAQAEISETGALMAVKAELEKEAAADKFSGAVLIATNGKAVFEQAVGEADREKKTPNTVETKFRFGSMGKMFTAVGVMQLVEAGKIKLEDPISKYLPDYPNKEVAAVTVYQLLTHTGGTGNIFTPEYGERRLEIKELKDYVKLFGERGADFKPGTDWDYSNYGFVLLGRIIEVASGQNYYDYAREHIFKPAGMDSTDNLPEDEHVADLSVGYTTGNGPGLMLLPPPGAAPGPRPEEKPVSGGPLKSTAGMLPYRGTSAGGGYSTVGDLLKFANALESHQLLDAEHTELLTTGKVTTRRRGKYGFGFEDETGADGVRRIGHGGGAPGMNGRLSIFPKSGYVVVVLSNFDPPAADDLAKFISAQLPLR